MYDFINNLLISSLMCSVAILATLSVKIIFGKRLSPKAHLYIWIPVILKLTILYTSPKSELSVYNYAPDNFFVQKLTNLSENSHSLGEAPLQVNLIMVIWGMGAFITFLISMYSYFVFLKGLKKVPINMKKIETISRNSAKACKLKAPPPIIICRNNISPMIIGFLKPKLLLPKNTIHVLDEKQLEIVFHHEYMHLKYKDYILNFLLLFLNTLHWFNPFVWLMVRTVKKDNENVCDERVLGVIGSDSQYLYGKTILDLSKYVKKDYLDFVISPMASSKRTLSSRLVTLYSFGKKELSVIILPICIMISITLLTQATAKKAVEAVDVITENLNPIIELAVAKDNPPPNIAGNPQDTPPPIVRPIEEQNAKDLVKHKYIPAPIVRPIEDVTDEINQEVTSPNEEKPPEAPISTITSSAVPKNTKEIKSDENVYIYKANYAEAYFSKDKEKARFYADNGVVRVEVVGISNSSSGGLSGYFNVYQDDELIAENAKGNASANANQIIFSTWGNKQYYSFDTISKTVE